MAIQTTIATTRLLRAALAIGLLALALSGAPASAQRVDDSYAPYPPPKGLDDPGDIVVEARALDKITARITDLELPEDQPLELGSLIITARYCYSRPPEEAPETYAFLEIDGHPEGARERLFTGWMIASSPALNALEHPVYDVWITGCRVDGDAAGDSSADSADAADPPAGER